MFAVMNGFIIATILSSASSRHRYKERMDMIVVSYSHLYDLRFVLPQGEDGYYCGELPACVQSATSDFTQIASPSSLPPGTFWLAFKLTPVL